VIVVAVPAQAAQGDHEDPPGEDAYGVVQNFPEHFKGDWTIDGTVYSTDRNTRFRMSAGPFYTGACVHVRYEADSLFAYLIETMPKFKCDGSGEGARQFLYGLIDEVPASYTDTLEGSDPLTATWVISGIEFVSTEHTYFDTHEGPLEAGACAGVKYHVVDGVNRADVIRTEDMYRCLGPVAYNQAYGKVVTSPPDLLGAWIISDTSGVTLTFETTATTKFWVTDLPIDPGDCVGVKYFTLEGVNNAVWVMTADPRFCQGIFGGRQPLSKIYATVDLAPTGTYTGGWVLAGVNFTATDETRFDEDDGPLAAGVCAEGKYDPANGIMAFGKLESEPDYKCQWFDGSPLFKLFGVVEVLPTGGYTGTWQVSGVSFEALTSTHVEQRHGDLATGAYVMVFFTYDAASGERTATLIKTHVAPGYGRINFRCRFGGWRHGPEGDNDQIILDGKVYEADPGIDIPNDVQEGDTVWANAYQDSDGTFVTQISADQVLYAPLILH
jgi:hypothetical protein